MAANPITYLGELFKSSRKKGEEGLPLLSVTLNDGLVERDQLDRRTETNLEANEHLLVQSGDIAYNMMRVWQGALGRARVNGLVSPAYVVLRPSAKIDSLYAEYLFKTPRMIYLFWAYSYGLTKDRLRLYFNDFARIPVAIPDLNEQKKIAEILATWDKAITTTEQLLANGQQQKKALMQLLLTGKKRLLDKNGVRFCGEWKERRLASICTLGAGQPAPQGDQYFQDGVHDFLRVSDLGASTSRWAPSSRDKVNDLAVKEGRLVKIKAGATIFTKSGASLLLNQRAQLKEDSYMVSHLGFAKALGDHSDDYIYYLLCAMKFEDYSAGTSLPALQLSVLGGIKILCPPLEEQQKITAVLSVADKEVAALQKMLETLKQEKKSLMQQLLSGKRRALVS